MSRTPPNTGIVRLHTPSDIAPAAPIGLFRRLLRSRLSVISLLVFALIVLLAAFGPVVYTQSATRPDYAAINAIPSAEHILGTDNLGRDTLARLLSGLRVSLIVALYVETLNILLGATLGLLAGYYGGILDVLVTRVADILFAFPGLLLAILVTAIFGSSVTEQFGGIGRLMLVAGSLSLVSWPLMARLVRSQVLVLREQEFVTAARSLGATHQRMILRHIIPNVGGIIIVASTLDVASVVVNEAVLSLLGLGIQPPDPSIGKMITDAIPYLETNAWQVFFPSAALMLIVLTVSFLGDGLREASDPQAR
ncbi:MAG: ABC transporter permease [Pleurocapsa minor GSE-CHR-MK-17-07R]|jgi:ABC-type dipeptide/oligopeptide/nickel transport system permease subunit|nr:ABC transporter permease [Pleurocapsa minor GSE-CHR-MK 17-07R]